MAIEDEIINISDLDPGTEILSDDKLLIETTNGTKLLNFKDFVIGTDNISFFDKISSAFGGSDSATSTIQTAQLIARLKPTESGNTLNIATTATAPGHITTYGDVSGGIELAKYNFNALTVLATLTAQLAQVNSALDSSNATIASIAAQTEGTLIIPVSSCSFRVEQRGESPLNSSTLKFNTTTVDPTVTNTSDTLSFASSPFSITYPSDTSYLAGNNSYSGNIILTFRDVNKANSARIWIAVDGTQVSPEFRPTYEAEGIDALVSQGLGQNMELPDPTTGGNAWASTFNINHIQSVGKGKTVTIGINDKTASIYHGSYFVGGRSFI